MTRRPLPRVQLSLDLNTPLPNALIPDEAVRVLADLLLEAAGGAGAQRREDGDEPQDHLGRGGAVYIRQSRPGQVAGNTESRRRQYALVDAARAAGFVIWFGIGIEMKVILTATIVFFLVFLNTYTGVRGVSRELVAIMKLMGARESDLLTKVVLPSVVTWVFTGLKLSVPYALIGALVGELD